MQSTGRRLTRPLPLLIPVFLLGGSLLLGSCKSDPPQAADPPPTDFRKFEAPQEDLDSLKYNPSFAPDYNNLKAQPWVEPATQSQTDDASVFADRIEFPSSHTEVLSWSPGRIVVAAPGKGAGMNGMGFARKVASVAQIGDTIVVMTVAPALEEILQGDFQMKFDPDKAQVVDLSKVDKQWVADNLYAQTPDVDNMPGEQLTDDYPPDVAPMGFFSSLKKKVTKAVTNVAKAVAKTAKDVYVAVTPATLNVSTGIKPEIKFGSKYELPILDGYKKTFKTKSNNNVELTLNAKYSYDANVTLNAGVQVAGKIGVPGHGQSSQISLNFDALAKAELISDLTLAAAISSVDGNAGTDLVDFLNDKLVAKDVFYGSVREKLFGDPDLKPSATWKKTLWISEPSEQTLFAGVVPVVFTETLQVDLECAFEAKASINAHFEVAEAATFKFGVTYDTGTNKATLSGPTLDKKFTKNINVLGQGSAMVTCGLVPRVNVFLYDMVGVFAGIRGSVVAKAAYTSECDPASFWPTGKVDLNVSANLGVQVGGRLQAPGASLLGIKGQVAGLNVGPLEPFTVNIPLYDHEWKFAHGFGWCLSTCFNKTRDFGETDIDCGGECAPCKTGQRCAMNTDCDTSRCSGVLCGPDTCGNKVQDGAETDIDCGGACGPCATGQSCEVGTDCLTGFCTGKSAAAPGVCVTDHCQDAVKDADEDGLDCAGKDCGKCADGTVVSRADSCMSGIFNGRTCVASSCTDNLKGGDESDRDCGGSCAARCGMRLGCSSTADCAKELSCSAVGHVCLRDQGTLCLGSRDCLSGLCVGNKCQAPPQSCQAIATAMPGAKDGNYTLFVGGDAAKPWTAYCKDMATAPKEYLTVSSTVTSNFSQWTAGGAAPGTSVRTSYSKVRIDPATLMVDITDQTFGRSTGKVTQGPGTITVMPYAMAADCVIEGSSSGIGNVDLTGTPFAVPSSQFVVGGYMPAGNAAYSQSNRIVNLSGGGYCGFIGPLGSGGASNAAGKPLQLQYQP